MKFKKYTKQPEVIPEKITEDFEGPFAELSYVQDEISRFYAPVENLIKEEKFEEAKAELDSLEADLNEFEAENSKKKFFRFPQFMIDGQRRRIEALKAKLPKNESIEDLDKRCENCNTLLNDSGTCPKCDDGEEDYGDKIEEALTNKEKLERAYPGVFNFDNKIEEPSVDESLVEETVREKLKNAFPELNFDKDDSNVSISEDLTNREKLQAAYPELNFDKKSEQDLSESTDDYDDEYEIEDDVEMDRRHAALYGGDRMYCDCGSLLHFDEFDSYCPVCDAEETELKKQADSYSGDELKDTDDLYDDEI